MRTRFSRRAFLATSVAAVSVSLPIASAAATTPSGKKGCGLTRPDPADWAMYVAKLHLDWVYTWGPERPAPTPRSVEFTPMQWGGFSEHTIDALLHQYRRGFDSGDLQHLLTFNEPDQQKQSNLSVEQVIEWWPRLMEIGIPLVSPGCVHPDRNWMRDFMKQIDQRQLRVDAVAVHSYGGPNVASLVRRLTQVFDDFGRPLWITEFAIGDWEATTPQANRHSAATVAAFMKEVLPALDELPFLQRYAWFPAGTSSAPLGTSALFDARGELTALGEIYAAHGPVRSK